MRLGERVGAQRTGEGGKEVGEGGGHGGGEVLRRGENHPVGIWVTTGRVYVVGFGFWSTGHCCCCCCSRGGIVHAGLAQ